MISTENNLAKKYRNGNKLLIYAHYYIPDAASTGQILCELAESIKDRFDITIICVVPSYLGIIDNRYKIRRYYEENISCPAVVLGMRAFPDPGRIFGIGHVLSQ